MTAEPKLYRIVRHYQSRRPKQKIIQRWATLEVVQAHCQGPRAKSMTPSDDWFDSYEEDGPDTYDVLKFDELLERIKRNG